MVKRKVSIYLADWNFTNVQPNERRRAVHVVILSPNKETSDKITTILGSKGRLDYDGRPIFGVNAKQLVKELKENFWFDWDNSGSLYDSLVWFFGSKSGFDSLEEGLGEQLNIFMLLSLECRQTLKCFGASRKMLVLLVFSDSHSFWPWRIGRESTVFEIPELTYEMS